MDSQLRVGTKLFGYCRGVFGDSFGDKRVEAIGADWVVARDESGEVCFYEGCPDNLLEYTVKEVTNV